jgi:hypothetical protein
VANDVATQKTASELLSEAAEELNGGNVGKILKFQKGKYFVGDDEIAINSELIAHVTQLARGWVKFKNGELVDRRIGKVVDGFVAPQRRDPWVSQSYLPLETPETGELIVFVSGSAGGRGAIGALVNIASRNLHKGQPIVQLGVRSYKHKQFGQIENPDFPIVGWTGAIGGARPVPPSTHPAFDDEIPWTL